MEGYMAEEIIPDQPSQNEIKKNRWALIIPFISGLLFSILCTSLQYSWSQDLPVSRRLTFDFHSAFNNVVNVYSLFVAFFIIGALIGLIPTIPIYRREKFGKSIIAIIISILLLGIFFCGCSWYSVWLVNP
jgi:hypothetical protein